MPFQFFLPELWTERLKHLSFAFQPVVSLHNGQCYGYEALLRGAEAAGFSGINDVFDCAYDDKILPELEVSLWMKAINQHVRLPNAGTAKLLCNADNRGALIKPNYRARIISALHGVGLAATSFCLEISERHGLSYDLLRTSGPGDGILHAIDDLGSEYAELERLHACPSDIVKIDRGLIDGIDHDISKQIVCRAIVALARQRGRLVVAEGVEKYAELDTCRSLGCNFVQGYYVQRPTLNLNELREFYDLAPPQQTIGRAA